MTAETTDVADDIFNLVMSAMGGRFADAEQAEYDRLCDLLDEIDRVGQPVGAP